MWIYWILIDVTGSTGDLQTSLRWSRRRCEVLIGRNGMHRYNNQDHAMLTGLLAARNIAGEGPFDLWRVNGDAEYLEEEQGEPDGRLVPRHV